MRYAEELRAAINRGETGDKVRWSDPAAAPLGTDEEAAGQAVPHESVALAEAYETSRPSRPAPTNGPGAAWLVIIAALGIGAVAIVSAVLA